MKKFIQTEKPTGVPNMDQSETWKNGKTYDPEKDLKPCIHKTTVIPGTLATL